MTVLAVIAAICGYLLLVLLVLVAMVLLVPFGLAASGAIRDDGGDLSASVCWGFGLLAVDAKIGEGVTIRVAGIRVYCFDGQAEDDDNIIESDSDADDAPVKPGRWRRAWAGRRTVWHMLRRLIGTLHLRGYVRGQVGLDDPADTVWLAALVYELDRRLPQLNVDVTYNWIEEELTLAGRITGRVWLIETLAVAAALLLVRENRELVRDLR